MDFQEPVPSEQIGREIAVTRKSRRRRLNRNTVMVLCLLSAFIGAIVGGSLVAFLLPPTIARNPSAPPSGGAPYSTSYTSSAADPTSPAVGVASKLGPSVVSVSARIVGRTVFGRTVTQDAGGSGVILTADGYIVTNNHVVQNASLVSVKLSDGRSADARIVGQDATADLAVIKVNLQNLTAAELGDSDTLRVGETVIAIGSPLSAEFMGSVTQGVISGLKRTIQIGDRTLQLIQTDAVINPGNSGGPLANAEGKVIGINTLKIDLQSVEGMGFAVPVNVVRPVVAGMIRKDGGKAPFAGGERSGV
jgi:serine protease Do